MRGQGLPTTGRKHSAPAKLATPLPFVPGRARLTADHGFPHSPLHGAPNTERLLNSALQTELQSPNLKLSLNLYYSKARLYLKYGH